MKNLSFGVVLALSLVGCSKKKPQENKEPPAPVEPGSADMGSAGSAAAAPAAEKPLAGKDLADKYVKCTDMINAGKYDDFKASCVSADYKGHMVDEGDIAADQLTAQFTALKTGFPDYKLSPQLVLVNNRDIFAVELSTGTNSGKLAMPGMPELPATNKKVGTLFFHRLAINDQNKATEEWGYEDPVTFMGQLGQLPKNAPLVRSVIDKGWSGAPNIAVADGGDKEKKNLEVVKSITEAFNAKKDADLLALVTDDAVESDQGAPKDNAGKKEIQQGLAQFHTAFPDGKVTVDNTWAAGDYVVSMGTFTGTNTGDMGPMKKTGKKVTSHMVEIFKLKDGKMTNVWRFMNGMAMMQQLGLMQAPAAPPAGGTSAGSAAPKK